MGRTTAKLMAHPIVGTVESIVLSGSSKLQNCGEYVVTCEVLLCRDVALKALQLSMVLLPLHIREELKCLLTFMRVASEEDAVKLSVKVSAQH